jgi:hypothetical protein
MNASEKFDAAKSVLDSLPDNVPWFVLRTVAQIHANRFDLTELEQLRAEGRLLLDVDAAPLIGAMETSAATLQTSVERYWLPAGSGGVSQQPLLVPTWQSAQRDLTEMFSTLGQHSAEVRQSGAEWLLAPHSSEEWDRLWRKTQEMPVTTSRRFLSSVQKELRQEFQNHLKDLKEDETERIATGLRTVLEAAAGRARAKLPEIQPGSGTSPDDIVKQVIQAAKNLRDWVQTCVNVADAQKPMLGEIGSLASLQVRGLKELSTHVDAGHRELEKARAKAGLQPKEYLRAYEAFDKSYRPIADLVQRVAVGTLPNTPVEIAAVIRALPAGLPLNVKEQAARLLNGHQFVCEQIGELQKGTKAAYLKLGRTLAEGLGVPREEIDKVQRLAGVAQAALTGNWLGALGAVTGVGGLGSIGGGADPTVMNELNHIQETLGKLREEVAAVDTKVTELSKQVERNHQATLVQFGELRKEILVNRQINLEQLRKSSGIHTARVHLGLDTNLEPSNDGLLNKKSYSERREWFNWDVNLSEFKTAATGLRGVIVPGELSENFKMAATQSQDNETRLYIETVKTYYGWIKDQPESRRAGLIAGLIQPGADLFSLWYRSKALEESGVFASRRLDRWVYSEVFDKSIVLDTANIREFVTLAVPIAMQYAFCDQNDQGRMIAEEKLAKQHPSDIKRRFELGEMLLGPSLRLLNTAVAQQAMIEGDLTIATVMGRIGEDDVAAEMRKNRIFRANLAKAYVDSQLRSKDSQPRRSVLYYSIACEDRSGGTLSNLLGGPVRLNQEGRWILELGGKVKYELILPLPADLASGTFERSVELNRLLRLRDTLLGLWAEFRLAPSSPHSSGIRGLFRLIALRERAENRNASFLPTFG